MKREMSRPASLKRRSHMVNSAVERREKGTKEKKFLPHEEVKQHNYTDPWSWCEKLIEFHVLHIGLFSSPSIFHLAPAPHLFSSALRQLRSGEKGRKMQTKMHLSLSLSEKSKGEEESRAEEEVWFFGRFHLHATLSLSLPLPSEVQSQQRAKELEEVERRSEVSWLVTAKCNCQLQFTLTKFGERGEPFLWSRNHLHSSPLFSSAHNFCQRSMCCIHVYRSMPLCVWVCVYMCVSLSLFLHCSLLHATLCDIGCDESEREREREKCTFILTGEERKFLCSHKDNCLLIQLHLLPREWCIWFFFFPSLPVSSYLWPYVFVWGKGENTFALVHEILSFFSLSLSLSIFAFGVS